MLEGDLITIVFFNSIAWVKLSNLVVFTSPDVLPGVPFEVIVILDCSLNYLDRWIKLISNLLVLIISLSVEIKGKLSDVKVIFQVSCFLIKLIS